MSNEPTIEAMNVEIARFDDLHVGYIAGATEWAEKAQELRNILSDMRDCLDAVIMINEVRPLQDSELVEDIKNVLAKYKEITNG